MLGLCFGCKCAHYGTSSVNCLVRAHQSIKIICSGHPAAAGRASLLLKVGQKGGAVGRALPFPVAGGVRCTYMPLAMCL